jgi:hypothetical protein
MLFSYFPPSFVLIFAREPIAATSITQAPFRFSTSLRPSRCIAVRHPCFDSTTEGGKRIFNTNEKQTPNTTRDTGARRLLCAPQATAIHRVATSRTAHKVGRPPVSQRRYEGGKTPVFKTKDQQHAHRKEHRPCNDTPPNQRPTFPSGQPC